MQLKLRPATDKEKVALRALLKRRIPEDDLEAIIEALAETESR